MPNPTDYLDEDVLQQPYEFLDKVRQTSPVWRVDSSSVYLVTGFDALSEAARRIDDFSSVLHRFLYRDEAGLPATVSLDLGPPTLATADPPTHTLHKQMIFPRFVSKRMMLIEEELTTYTEACLDRAAWAGEFDFMDEVGNRVPIHAISRLIGFKDGQEAMLLEAALDSSHFMSGTVNLDELLSARLRVDEINSWLETELAARTGEGDEDLLDAVKAAIVNGALSHTQGLTTTITLLSAGGESTGSLLGNAVRMLASDPELVPILQRQPDLLPAFIEEAGRLESPFRYHLRYATRDTELGGVAIPEASTVLLMWGAANRDPAKFEEPTKFSLERRQQHVVFGRGIHLCVGAALARMEARIVLGAMLKRDRFPQLSSTAQPVWEPSAMIRRHLRLPMVWQ